MYDYKSHLKDLRTQYINATYQQRISVAEDRINYPDCYPNQLITIVSATEALARAKCIEVLQSQGKTATEAYEKTRITKTDSNGTISVRCAGPILLIENLICPSVGKTSQELFGKDIWETFSYAIEYRNLLIHEGTFLRQDYAISLINSCHEVFNLLKKLETV